MGSMQASRVPVGLDFFGLREYEVGDDLRRVHWRSTARTGELMLRQDEMPWEARSTILLDTRPSTHHGESFERAVEIAASLATAMCRGRRQVRFVHHRRGRHPLVRRRPLRPDHGVPGRRLGGDLRPVGPGHRRPAPQPATARWRPSWPTPNGPTSPPSGHCDPGSASSSSVAIRPSAYGERRRRPRPGRPGRARGPRLGRQPLPHAWNQAVVTCQRSAAVRS